MASENPGTTQPLEQGFGELRHHLLGNAARFMPADKPISAIRREDFTSRSFRHEEGPTIKQRVDGHIYEISFEDGSKTFVLHHKTTGGNPAADPAFFGALLPMGGLDTRKWETFVYEWDGRENISATEPNGKVTDITGEYETPDAMLPTLRQSLGHHQGIVNFTQTSAEQ